MSSRREFLHTAIGAGFTSAGYARLPWRPSAVDGVSVRDFGAVGDGSTDDTDAFRRALDGADVVRVPAGTYRIDGTIVVGEAKHLALAADSVLFRAPQGADAPVVRLAANHAALTGRGEIRADVPTPLGVIHVGPADPQTPADINWTFVGGVRIIGAAEPGSIGLKLTSSEATVGGSNYNGTFSDLFIASAGTGIDIGPICNAHTFTNVFFYRIVHRCYNVERASENSFFGGFTHYSPGATVIRLAGALFNLFYGVQAEPGDGSRYFDVDESSIQCQIIGHDNCPLAPSLRSASSMYVGNGRIVAPSVNTGQLNVGRLASTFQVTRAAPDRSDLTEEIYQPLVLDDTTKRGVRITGLRRDSAAAHASALAFEILVSGHAGDDHRDSVYSAKLLVTAYNRADGAPHLHVRDLAPPENVRHRVDPHASALELEFDRFRGSSTGEVLCAVRKIGLPQAAVAIKPM